MAASHGRNDTPSFCSMPLFWEVLPVAGLWENVLGSWQREPSGSASRSGRPTARGQVPAGAAWRRRPPARGGPVARKSGSRAACKELLTPRAVHPGTSLASVATQHCRAGLDLCLCCVTLDKSHNLAETGFSPLSMGSGSLFTLFSL